MISHQLSDIILYIIYFYHLEWNPNHTHDTKQVIKRSIVYAISSLYWIAPNSYDFPKPAPNIMLDYHKNHPIWLQRHNYSPEYILDSLIHHRLSLNCTCWTYSSTKSRKMLLLVIFNILVFFKQIKLWNNYNKNVKSWNYVIHDQLLLSTHEYRIVSLGNWYGKKGHCLEQPHAN